MKRNPWSVIIPLVLSIMVLFFLFKNETKTSTDNNFPIFKISGKKTEVTETPEPVAKEDEQFTELRSKIEQEQGTYGLYIKDMVKNKEYDFNPDEQFYPLSLFKVPIAYIIARDVEKGVLNWEDTIEYKQEDYYDGFGSVGLSGVGSEFRLDRLVELMIRESDNTAPKILKRELGEDYLNEEYKKITGDRNADLFNEELYTTPKKCSQTLEGIIYKKWISDESVNLLLSFMYPTSYDTTVTPYLDESLTFYHKVGIMEEMYHNCGIVKGEEKDLIVCLMSRAITEESFDNVSNHVAKFINEL